VSEAEQVNMNLPARVRQMTPVTGYREIREILGSRDFSPAARERHRPFVLGTLALSEGTEHAQRRRLEAPLFRPGILLTRHSDNVNQATRSLIRPLFDKGLGGSVKVDLVDLVVRLESFIMARFVGLVMPDDPLMAIDDLCRRMSKINEMASLPWSRRLSPLDTVQDAWRLRHDMVEFADIYLMGAVERAIRRDRSSPPETVIETIVDGFDPHRMDGELILREAWTFMAAGVQTSAFSILDAVPHLLAWFDKHPEGVQRALDQGSDFLGLAVAESLRLNIPNPAILRVALRDGVTPSGRAYKADDEFVLHTAGANRDPAFFGDDVNEFNPDRVVKEGVPRWGFSFGHGHHACIGRPFALGRATDGNAPEFEGSTVSILRALIACGLSYVPGDPPVFREDTYKAAFKTFPALLTQDGLTDG
jgi:cytochrome P450